MAKYQRVSPKFWQDPKVRRWPDHQKLLGAYLLTCPHRTSEGLFWLPHGYVAQDLGWSIERVSEGYSGLNQAGFCAYDEVSETVLLCNALKYEAPAGPKQIQGAITRLADVPPSPLFMQLRDAAARYAPDFHKALDYALEHGILRHHRGPTDTPPKGYGYRTDSSSSSSSSSSNSNSSSKINTVVDGEVLDPSSLVAQARPIDDTTAVFQTWQEAAHKPRARLDEKRRRLIQAALKHYPLQDILDAVRGWQVSPHHRGENPQHTLYNDLGLLLRDSAHIENFRDLWRDGPPLVRGQPVTRQERGRAQLLETHQALTAWANQEGGDHGTGAMDDAGQQAQRELPRPGTPA